MGFLKKVDGAMQPVRLLTSFSLLLFYEFGIAFCFAVELPWASVPFIVMALFSLWGFSHNLRNRYWYHRND